MIRLLYDCETSSLDPRVGGLTEVSAMVADYSPDWSTYTVLGRMSSFVKPDPDLDYEPKALEIQGVTMEKLEAEGRPVQDVFGALSKLVNKYFGAAKKCAPIAHNAPFDKSFVDATCERYGLAQPTNHCWRDSVQWFRLLQDLGANECYKASLDVVCEWYRIEIPAEVRHSALGDVEALAKAVSCMMQDFRRLGA